MAQTTIGLKRCAFAMQVPDNATEFRLAHNMPPVLTSIEFEPALPEGTVAHLVLNDRRVQVDELLASPELVRPRSQAGRALSQYMEIAGEQEPFVDQSAYDVVNIALSRNAPTGTKVVLRGLNLEQLASGQARDVFSM